MRQEEYRTQHKDAWLVDGMPIFENLLMAFISAAGEPLIGSDAVWLSFPLAEFVCLTIIAATVFKNAGKITLKLGDWLKVDENFGRVPTLERAFSSLEDVHYISEEVVNFARTNRLDSKISTFAGVITEELLNNVATHGAHSSEFYLSYIRVTADENLTLRIYDDNRKFNPKIAMKKIETESGSPAEKKYGLLLVKQITSRYGAFDYQNTAGINTSIVTLNEDKSGNFSPAD